MTYTYNSFGEVLKMTDPLGHVTTNTYDSHGNLLTVTTPAPNGTTAAGVTQFAYNALGHTTNIAYNSVGLIGRITDRKATSRATGMIRAETELR